MLSRFNAFFAARKEYAALFIRFLVGFHLVYTVRSYVFDWNVLLEFKSFLASKSVPQPLFAAMLCVYSEFICGILFLLGAWVRPAAIIMVINFIVALGLAHLGDAYQALFPALAMLLGSAFLLFNGAGNFSVDQIKTRNPQH